MCLYMIGHALAVCLYVQKTGASKTLPQSPTVRAKQFCSSRGLSCTPYRHIFHSAGIIKQSQAVTRIETLPHKPGLSPRRPGYSLPPGPPRHSEPGPPKTPTRLVRRSIVFDHPKTFPLTARLVPPTPSGRFFARTSCRRPYNNRHGSLTNHR